jgi:MoxR-like ATPase
MNNQTLPKFTGNPNNRPKNQKFHPDTPEEVEPYYLDENDELIKAVNLAIHLKRPLLIEGEAGCGKTRLAKAVAYELGLPYYRWDVRSTSTAKEGLYQYDAISRLHDVQVKQIENQAKTKNIDTDNKELKKRDPQNPKDYRKLGALGKAFDFKDEPSVVLIDEIDKADVDFPNDLLAVLDEPWSFSIPETGETIEADKKNKPIIIITSNKEKGNLPAPFLRRCIYYYINFPNDIKKLEQIVNIHYQTQPAKKPNNNLMKTAIAQFLAVRDLGLFKRPGTSEFLDWLEALANFESQPYSANKLKRPNWLPYYELLFKLHSDLLIYQDNWQKKT